MIHYGLVLSGGGARAAYQAGVLKGLAQVLSSRGIKLSFSVISGVSAGAINSAYLASYATELRDASHELCELWSKLTIEQVVQTHWTTLGKIGVRWLRDLSLGGVLGNSRSTFLLDASPLYRLLESQIRFSEITKFIEKGVLKALAVSVLNYRTGTGISFFEGAAGLLPWVRSSRLGQRTKLTLAHIMASASIPVLFAPVRIGHTYYGDGGIRLLTPLSPAIRLGADRIVAIGIRSALSDQLTWEENQTREMHQICLADIAGAMLNAALLDHLDADLERLQRINQTVSLLSPQARAVHPYPLRVIPTLMIRPSQDLGTLASEQFHRFPLTLRYLMRGIGASDLKGWDLLSYLAFDQTYCRLLIDLGLQDVSARKEEILRFFSV
ncbi:MAG: patatin-like phospholipase family protein [Bdellovibrionia bacterium]